MEKENLRLKRKSVTKQTEVFPENVGKLNNTEKFSIN